MSSKGKLLFKSNKHSNENGAKANLLKVLSPMTTTNNKSLRNRKKGSIVKLRSKLKDTENNARPPGTEMFTGSHDFDINGGTHISAVSVTINHGAVSRSAEEEVPARREGAAGDVYTNRPFDAMRERQHTQSSAQIYYNNLIGKGHGSPLWYPEPDLNLPEAYRRKGVSIGDVGLLSPAGNFDFLFNIYLSRDHPINSGGVPDNFVPFDDSTGLVRIRKLKDDSTCVVSQSIDMSNGHSEGEIIFQSSASEGAILTMPYGAYKYNLINTLGIKKYISKYIESWYKFVLEVIQCDVHNGDLRVVMGCDKTSKWGVAAFVNCSESVSLRFQRPFTGEGSHRWHYSGSIDARTGPSVDSTESLEDPNDLPSLDAHCNQCIFIRTFNMSIRDDIWKEMKDPENQENQLGDGETLSSDLHFHQVSARENSTIQGFSSEILRSSAISNVSLSMMSHPSNGIHSMIWQNLMTPERQVARVLITEDNDWLSVLTGDDAKLPDSKQIYERIMKGNPHIYEDTDIGFVTLQSMETSPNELVPYDSEVVSASMGRFSLSSQTMIGVHNKAKGWYEWLLEAVAARVLHKSGYIVDPPTCHPPAQMTPRKKALLIGVAGPRSRSGQRNHPLIGAHRDVREMGNLLEEVYDYKPENIIVLLDDDVQENSHLQPTEANIIKHIKGLVCEAKDDDHFFFHFAGHTGQSKTDDDEEEDGMNELMMTSDGKEIMDNDLRKYLVDPLPHTCSLTAVIDSCHSHTLLDLPHSRCNQVYVPWLDKGYRTDKTQRKNVRRQLASRLTRTDSKLKDISEDLSSQVSLMKGNGGSSSDPIPAKPMRIPQRKKALGIKIELIEDLPANGTNILTPSQPTPSTSMKPGMLRPPRMERQLSESPIAKYCTGYCRNQPILHDTLELKADVVCLSAAKDSELAWEDTKGRSLTAYLVDILRETPQRSLKEVLILVSHKIHEHYIPLHRASMDHKKKVRLYSHKRSQRGKKEKTIQPDEVEDHNFQNPQISSHRPLDMSKRFRI